MSNPRMDAPENFPRFQPPEDLQYRCGKLLRTAREAINVDRSEVSDLSGLDFLKVLKFEKGAYELTAQLWKGYVKSLLAKEELRELNVKQASALLRGFVNEIRASHSGDSKTS